MRREHPDDPRRLAVHRDTVRRWKTSVYRKLGAVGAANAVAIAIRDGLINVNQRADQQ